MDDLTSEQRSIFDLEIGRLRDRLSRRRAVMAIPSLKQRADAIGRLRLAVENLKAAAARQAPAALDLGYRDRGFSADMASKRCPKCGGASSLKLPYGKAAWRRSK